MNSTNSSNDDPGGCFLGLIVIVCFVATIWIAVWGIPNAKIKGTVRWDTYTNPFKTVRTYVVIDSKSGYVLYRDINTGEDDSCGQTEWWWKTRAAPSVSSTPTNSPASSNPK